MNHKPQSLGFDILDELIEDESVTEIMINGISSIFFEKNGKLIRSDNVFRNETELHEIIEAILKPLGKSLKHNHPYTDARLCDGSRVNIIMPPVSLTGPMITIRKFCGAKISGDYLIDSGSLNSNMLKFLKICVHSKKNIIVSGGTGSGKTTMLNTLSTFIDTTDRIITIEDTAELQLRNENIGRLESKPADSSENYEVTIRQLLRNSLRMRPDRIIVGECRGNETIDMLQAMNTGHNGSMATIHANSPRDCLKRIEVMSIMAGLDIPMRALREIISSAINIIVQVSRFEDGTRKITNISEIAGLEGDVVTIAPIFEFIKENTDHSTGKINGRFLATRTIPSFIEVIAGLNIKFDMEVFK